MLKPTFPSSPATYWYPRLYLNSINKVTTNIIQNMNLYDPTQLRQTELNERDRA